MREGQPIAPVAGTVPVILAFPRAVPSRPVDGPRQTQGRLALLMLWHRRWRARREMRALAIFEPDSVLADIGIDREEAWRRARTPFWRP